MIVHKQIVFTKMLYFIFIHRARVEKADFGLSYGWRSSENGNESGDLNTKR
jgi:hypothetical protein